MLMKELKIPWNNWSSFERETPASVFPPGDARAGHPWFTGKLATQDGLDDLILRCPPRSDPFPGSALFQPGAHQKSAASRP